MGGDLIGVIRYALGFTLALAFFWKVKDFRAFRLSLGEYGLSGGSSWAAAAAVVCAEAVAAAASFASAGDLTVGVAGASLGLLFTAAQSYLLATGQRSSCMCFGEAAAAPVSVRSWVTAALVLLAGLLLTLSGSHGPRPVDPVLAGCGALVVAGLTVVHRRAARARS